MRIDWGDAQPRYEAGVDRGVLYLSDSVITWNGLTTLDEKDIGAVDTTHYFDGIRRLVSRENNDFQASISAYTYPDVLDESLRIDGFSYRTFVNDVSMINVVYNPVFQSSPRLFSTIDRSVNPSMFGFELNSSCTDITWARPTSRLIIDTSRSEYATETVENWLYGSDTLNPRLPTAAEFIELFESITTMRITYNGDGTYTASGPDDIVITHDDGVFDISAPSAFLLDDGRFVVDSF